MTVATDPGRLAVSRQGHYAGPVTRLASFAVDQATVTATATVVLAATDYSIDLVTRGRVQLSLPPLVIGLGYSIWWLVYFSYPLAVSGRTLGKALLGLRVVSRDGARLGPRQALWRTACLPLGFLTLGLGFAGIVFGRENRGWHDRLAGSAVVYDWDARAAQLRFLADTHREP